MPQLHEANDLQSAHMYVCVKVERDRFRWRRTGEHDRAEIAHSLQSGNDRCFIAHGVYDDRWRRIRLRLGSIAEQCSKFVGNSAFTGDFDGAASVGERGENVGSSHADMPTRATRSDWPLAIER